MVYNQAVGQSGGVQMVPAVLCDELSWAPDAISSHEIEGRTSSSELHPGNRQSSLFPMLVINCGKQVTWWVHFVTKPGGKWVVAQTFSEKTSQSLRISHQEIHFHSMVHVIHTVTACHRLRPPGGSPSCSLGQSPWKCTGCQRQL